MEMIVFIGRKADLLQYFGKRVKGGLVMCVALMLKITQFTY